MAITAKEIQEQGFEHSRKGYDVQEVDDFLEHVAKEVDALNRQNAELRVSLAEAQEATRVASPGESSHALSIELAEAQSQISELKGKLAERTADAEAISSAIIAAQKSADKIRQDARDDAKRIYNEAENKAREVIREALDRKKRTLEDVEHLKETRSSLQSEFFALIHKFEEQGTLRFTDTDDIFEIDMSAYEESIADDEAAIAAMDSSETNSFAAVEPSGGYDILTDDAPVSSYGDTEDDFNIDDLD